MNTGSQSALASSSTETSDRIQNGLYEYEKPPYIMKKALGITTDIVEKNEITSTFGKESESAYVPKVITPFLITKNNTRFKLLQFWEGQVEEVNAENFIATIQDKTSLENPKEGLELSLQEISDEDKEFVCPGAIFYWSIGYEDSPGRPRQRVSRIRFRRLPSWSLTEIKTAEEKAKIYMRLFE